MLKIPEEIFNVSIREIEVGVGEIYLYAKDEIQEAQIGYVIDNEKRKIDEWFGEEYIVIGNDTCLGDPIIAKVDEIEIPIYYTFNDDWDNLQKISNSFKEYIDILNKIEEIDLEDMQQCKDLLKNIKNIVPEEGYEYWESLIETAYEFLTDEEFIK